MDFQDKTIKCSTCGREFLFTAREQEFFLSKSFKEPRHCRECRQLRKREREQAIAEATGQAYQPGREMFQVVCAQCNRETFVPFKPITGKPVLCKDCFIAQRYGAHAQPLESEREEEKPPSPEEERDSAVTQAIPAQGAEIDLESEAETPPKEKPETEIPPPEAEPEKTSEPSAAEEKDLPAKVKESSEEDESEQEKPEVETEEHPSVDQSSQAKSDEEDGDKKEQ